MLRERLKKNDTRQWVFRPMPNAAVKACNGDEDQAGVIE
jgi:hypothetical protein